MLESLPFDSMLVTCKTCGSAFEVDDARVRPTGLLVKCAACGKRMIAMPASAPSAAPPAAPARRPVDEETADLPAPVGSQRPPSEEPFADLPAPRVAAPASAPTDTDEIADLPTPVGFARPPSDDDAADLPAPVGHAHAPAGDDADLPAPVGFGPAVQAFDAGDDTDLPAPRGGLGSAKPQRPSWEDEPTNLPPPFSYTDLPIPKGAIDLPAPKGAIDLPAPKGPSDLPAPKGAIDVPAPKGPANLPAPKSAIDVPAPKGPANLPAPKGAVDLPAPKGPANLPGPKGAIDVPGPRPAGGRTLIPPAPSPVTLDVPAGADEPTVAGSSRARHAPADPDSLHFGGSGLAGLDIVPGLDELDDEANAGLPVPKGHRPAPVVPAYPESATDLVRPKGRPAPPEMGLADAEAAAPVDGEALDLLDDEARALGLAVPVEGEHDPLALPVEDAAIPPSLAPAAGEEAAAPAPGARRRAAMRIGALVAGSLLVLGAAGFALDAFTGGTVFGSRKSDHRRALIVSARRLLGDDTLASYRKAAAAAREVADEEVGAREPRALQAQAHLAAALLGVSSELKPADQRLAELATNAPKKEDAETAKARALHALVDGKSKDAETLLKPLAGARDAAADVYLGWTHLAALDPPAALHDFQHALTIEPNRPAALIGLGRTEEALGDRAAALAAYKNVLAMRPDHLAAALGVARLADGDEAAIRALLEKAGPQAAPRDLAEGWALLAARSFESGRAGEAIDRFKQSLKLDPARLATKVGMARVYTGWHRAVEGLPLLQQVLKASPRDVDALVALAEAQLVIGQPTQAGKTLDSVEKLAPKLPLLPYLRGRSEEDRGGEGASDRAATLFRAAIAADAKNIDAYVALARVLAASGHAADAKRTLADAEGQAASDPALRDRLGEAYLAAGDLAKAETTFREISEKAPRVISARLHLAETLEREGRLEQAEAVYAALAVDQKGLPGLAERRGALAFRRHLIEPALAYYKEALAEGRPAPSLLAVAGDVDYAAGKHDEARKLYEACEREDEHNAAAHFGLARIALEENRLDEAEPEAKRAALLSDSPEAHLLYGRVDERLGRYDLARREYDLAAVGATRPAAQIARARLMIRSGAVKDALAELQAAQKAGGDTAESWILVGDCYDELTQRDRALHAYEAALERDTASAEAAFKLARAESDEGRDRAAAALLDRTLKTVGDKAPFVAEALLLDGDLHKRFGEREAAAAAYRHYLLVAAADAPERRSAEQSLANLQSSN